MEVTVAAEPAKAFAVFTDRIGEWWPLQTHCLSNRRFGAPAMGVRGSAFATLRYSLVANAMSVPFAIDAVSGNITVSGALNLDWEDQPLWTPTVVGFQCQYFDRLNPSNTPLS